MERLMKKKTIFLISVFMVVGIISQPVRGFALMGPPKALLAKKQYNAGINYSYSEMDLTIAPDADAFTIKNFKSNIILGNIGIGVHKNVDAFVCLGIGQAKINKPGIRYNGNQGLAWGVGTRATFRQKDDLTWGGLVQITGANTKDSSLLYTVDTNNISVQGDLNWYEIQVTIGPTWQRDGFCIYGGPLLHAVHGDLDIQGTGVTPSSFKIREKSQFGGYAGAQYNIGQKTICFLEGIFTGNAWGISIGGLWKFE
jgi:hypothetical protein